MNFTLLILLIGQGNLGVQQVEASEVLQRKPVFHYQFPEWVTDEYLFSLAGFSLDEEIEKCIDATILTSELGGNPLTPGLGVPSEQLARLRPDSALKGLEMQLNFSPSPDVRRQIFFYRITADWLRGDIDGVKSGLRTLEADKDASQGAPMEEVRSLVTFWEKGQTSTKDSLLYYILVKRDPSKALKFIPAREAVGLALRYHLEDTVRETPPGIAGRYLRAHRLVKAGRYAEALDSLKILSEIRSPYWSLVKYDMAMSLLGLGKSREAHLAVPDTFLYQWLVPTRALALVRGRVEWMENRPDAAKTWFKKASEDPAYATYSQWIMGSTGTDPATQAYFEKRNAGDLYRLLRISGYLRKKDYDNALLILSPMVEKIDMSGASPISNIVVSFYASCENEKGNYELVLRLADVVKNRGQQSLANLGTRGEDFFVTASHLAIADAYYNSGGRYEKLSRPFYEYCTKSRYSDLRHMGYLGLAWSLLAERDVDGVRKLVSALKSDSPTERESQVIIFLEGLTLYAARDFKGAAEVFSHLNFSSVPEMRMQGLYFEGRSYEQSGRYDLAGSAYQDLLNAFPSASEVRDAWSRLARAQIEMGSPEDAQKTLDRLIEQAKLYHFQFSDLYKEILLLIFDSAMAKGDEEQAKQFAERLSRTQNSTLPIETFYYRIAAKDTALWQVDNLGSIIGKLEVVNPESPYLPPILLQTARMEIELADYAPAIKRLETIVQWRKLSDVNDILQDASYELVRALVLSKDWQNTITRSNIFLASFPESDNYTPRVLYFLAFSLVKRAGGGDPLVRKEDGKKALEALDRLERTFPQSDFTKQSSEDLRNLRHSAEMLIN